MDLGFELFKTALKTGRLAPMKMLWGLLVGVAFALSFPSSAARGVKAQVTEDCDALGPDLHSFKSSEAEACGAACIKEATCRAWTHVSGWNRCFLKKKVSLKSGVRMLVGQIDRKKDPVEVSILGWRKDDSGKDLRRIAPTTKPEDCSAACLQEALCVGFVFIEGHNVCWLKKSQGKVASKVFSCGVNPES